MNAEIKLNHFIAVPLLNSLPGEQLEKIIFPHHNLLQYKLLQFRITLGTRSNRFLIFLFLKLFLLTTNNQDLRDIITFQLNFIQFRIDTLNSFEVGVDEIDGYFWVTDIKCGI